MRFTTQFLGAAAAIAVLAGASSAGAVTLFTQIDQPTLDSFGSATYGATTTDLGLFTHTFSFTTTGLNTASASVVTIMLQSGKKDIDFSSVFLDGFAFTKTGSDPFPETWGLATALLLPGVHNIVLKGTVVSVGMGGNPSSYSGTLNIEGVSVPEPGTWALMILGFGGAGAMLRRRRQAALAA